MPSRPFRVSPPLLLALPLLGACASQGEFPSLAPRAVERDLTGGSEPAGCPDSDVGTSAAGAAPETPALPANPDPQLGARVAELLAAARAGQSTFADALPRANASAARAGAAGSETWIAAQQEMSRLEAARTRTADALAELDALAIRRSDAPVRKADYQSLMAAAGEVRALAQAQEAELDRLAGLISEP